MDNVVIIFGAGATKACGGPLTNEILTRAITTIHIDREDFLATLNDFLRDNFHEVQPGIYPSLPLLISFIDTAIDRNHSLGPNWSREKLSRVRAALDYVIFAVLEYDLKTLQRNYYLELYQHIIGKTGQFPTTISLNYDIIADNAISRWSNDHGNPMKSFPDYCCDITSPAYQDKKGTGRLLKLHGSLNWLYCPNCNRLDVGISESGKNSVKMLEELYIELKLEDRLSCHGRPCLSCGSEVEPVMISPTYFKDYRNPHISRIWYEADQALRHADKVIIIGYSLPEDDLDVLYLLKRSMSHLDPINIHVVEYDMLHRPVFDHPVGQRYATLWGNQINWYTDGFEGFLQNNFL